MDTYASLMGLATNFYKSKKNAVELILREAISNAIHACILEHRQQNQRYLPKIYIHINSQNNSIKIIDNGIGFSESDKKIFFDIAQSNSLKQENSLPSKGLGRLVFVYFGKNISFSTAHNKQSFSFIYPPEIDLFTTINEQHQNTSNPNGTTLNLNVDENYMETFIKKFKVIDDFEEWILDNFAFLLYDFNDLKIHIDIDNNAKNIEISKINKKEFSIQINNQQYNLEILIVDSNANLDIKLVAHKLLIDKRVKYDRTIKGLKKKVYIASPLLDDRITPDGLNAEIDDIKQDLEQEITKILDIEFAELISKQREESCNNLSNTKNELPFLAEFMPSFDSVTGHKIQQKRDFIQEAIKEKADLEQKFWESDDSQLDTRLQKSALYLYVKHRERVLALLEKMMGDSSFKEDDFHQLLTDRKCENLEVANHNLWLLDDKFSYFFEAHNAQSGESNVDIEFYLNPFINDEGEPTHIVLVELKRLTKAHNAGEMIEQLKKYATQIYKNAKTKGGVNIQVEKCQFFGYIIADINDIKKEENSQDEGKFKPIPYTESSFEGIVSFMSPKDSRIPLNITLLSAQDLLKIAKLRNKTLFEILNMTNPKIDENEQNNAN
ncbi:ATP-binding protein [Helicobacter sp. T3_23-1059]